MGHLLRRPHNARHPFRRASEEGLIDLTASCHVGTRGPLYSKQDLEDDERLGFSIVSSEYIEEHGVEAAIDRILTRIGDKPLYVSIDIDVLDPAHAPGTGTPRPVGSRAASCCASSVPCASGTSSARTSWRCRPRTITPR